MATIDYKEKYEQALERAKYYHDRDNIQFLENIFPELCESDDERIRKELISFVRGMLSCHDKPNAERDEKYESWIAWLEKECEKDKFIEKELECIKGYREDAIKRLEELEKQSKDSPVLSDSSNIGKYVWSEEDERIRIKIIELLETANHPNKMRSNGKPIDFTENINWLKSIKYRIQPQLEQDFIDDDKEQIKKISEVINNYYPYNESSKMRIWLNSIKDRIEWLKSIISRQQPKQEWNEDDKSVLEDIKVAVASYWDEDTENIILDWLKSLRPQSQWKPSEGQLEALKIVCDGQWEPDGLDPLYTLWEQLKKLREE